ncbi:MAG TPA: baseplate J/gp47 family protein [Rhizobium sp.]|nr:baseplate J/gp47 family protein [Rhizobium sp.]
MADLLRTAQEDVDLAIDDMLARNPSLDARRTGTLVNTVAGVGALLKRDAQRFSLREFAKTFFQTAQGADLDLLAEDHLSLVRHPATAAVGEIVLYRSSIDTPGSVEAGTLLIDATGAEYSVLETTSVTDFTTRIPVQASTLGKASNRVRNTRFAFRNSDLAIPFLGLVLFNQEPLAGGNERETDEAFRRRIGDWWRSLRRGTIGAIRFVARSVPTIREATVDEQNIRPHMGGYVDLFVTDGSDAFNSVLGRQVRTAVDRDARAAGVVVNVRGAEVVPAVVRVRFLQRAGTSPGAVSRALAAISTYVNSLRIGDPLRRSRIAAVALAADSALLDVQVEAPAADLIPTASQVFRLSAENLTVT